MGARFHGHGERVIWLNVGYASAQDLATTVTHEVVHCWQDERRGRCLDEVEHAERRAVHAGLRASQEGKAATIGRQGDLEDVLDQLARLSAEHSHAVGGVHVAVPVDEGNRLAVRRKTRTEVGALGERLLNTAINLA